MRRASFRGMNCSVAQSLEVVGEWWTLLIVRDAFLGVSRFEEFQQRVGIARNILATRLAPSSPQASWSAGLRGGAGVGRLRLTEKGKALWPS